jgi:TolB-like protein/DNA-binding winged helix-turn-helix (wHTH) protein/Tfp pilus assembly protein PilF
MASEPVRIQETIRFGEDFELNLRLAELRRSGRVLKLERIPTELLLLLVEQRDSIVTREQIVQRIWGPGVFLDTDNSINGAIRKIRQVLKDNPERPRFIQTVTGKGYRFIALNAVDTAPRHPAADLDTTGREQRASISVRWALAGATVLLAVLAVGFGSWRSRNHARPQAAGGRLMLAVLPFDNLTGDAGQEYFSDGLTEEMITQLGGSNPRRMGVIARTSVMQYKHKPENIARIAQELGVQYILEGSVRRNSDRVRITAQLIRASDQTHVWAREYDREPNDVLLVQLQIAQDIAGEINVALDGANKNDQPARAGLSPSAYQAYNLYLKGRYSWNKRTLPGFRQAVKFFEQSISTYPNYARAYAGLADAYAMMATYGQVPAIEYMPKARAAALQALQLDDSLAEAHTSLALIAQNFDYDWRTADQEFRRAIDLNPNYATAHHWYAESLSFRGRFAEALAESEQARQLDPMSLIIAADNAVIYYFARQQERAIERFRGVLELDPTFPRASVIIGCYIEEGRTQDALAYVEHYRRTADTPWTSAWTWDWEAVAYGRAGDRAKAIRAVHTLEKLFRKAGADPTASLAHAYAGMGDHDKAIFYLERAYRNRSNILTIINVEPIFDSLHADPRFQDLLRRVGLGPVRGAP